MPHNFPILVSSGTSEGWQRPTDWLPIPTISTGEEVIYILVAVRNLVGNFIAFRISGDYTVDWGDGNIENVASGVKAEHSYAWADVGDVTSDGFRQALIKITPQAGSHITLVDFQEYHTTIGAGKSSQFIDLVLNIPNVSGSNIIVGYEVGNATYHRNVQRLAIYESGNLTNLQLLLNSLTSLRKLILPTITSITNLRQFRTNCNLIDEQIDISFSNVSNMDFTYRFNYGVRHISHVLPSVTSAIYMVQDCFNLISISVDMPIVTNITAFFDDCRNIICVEMNVPNVTTTTNMFLNTGSIQKCVLTGITVGFNVANNQMSATALNELFTSLGTADGVQSIMITGNYGAATCDTTIATAKGWTIVS